jgi:hypothetical protein
MTPEGAGEYLVNELSMLLLVMQTKTEIAQRARVEIAEIVMAWRDQRLLPRTQTPTLNRLYDDPDLRAPDFTPQGSA